MTTPTKTATKPNLLRWSAHVPYSDVQDPLGLSLRGSARLASRLLHCITSITPRARYFSFIPWCFFDFQSREKARPHAPGLKDAVMLRENALALACIKHHQHKGGTCKGGNVVGTIKAKRWLRKGEVVVDLTREKFAESPALNAYFTSLVNLGLFVTEADKPVSDEEGEDIEFTWEEIELSPLGTSLAKNYDSVIDRAVARAGATDDWDRDARPAGSAPDVGADEFRVAGSPEVQVLDGTADVADGGSAMTMSTVVGVATTKTFTVKNLGTQTLTLGPVSVSGAGFGLASGLGSSSLAPGQSTTFSVRLDASAAGNYSGNVSFTNNDSNENPFDFALTGTVTAAPAVQIIDDGESGFSTTVGWVVYGGQGRQNDITYAAADTGSAVATWSFAVDPGQYRVSATWTTHANRATNAPYRVHDGATLLGAVRLNQEQAPNDLSDQGSPWEDLGTFSVSGSSLVVTLANDANEFVIADSIRVERVG